MATLRLQFSRALTNIEINGVKAKRAKQAHAELRAVLEADDTLRSWGVDTCLIGSYARDSGIYPGKDVDVLVRFTALDTDASPKEIYMAVWNVLMNAYGGRVSPQARSIKVAFPAPGDTADKHASFAVDAVPAVRDGVNWAIPTKDRGRWAERTGRWVCTNPVRFAELSSALSTSLASPTVGGQNAYKPIVKLTRQTRRAHLADRRPGGLYIEFAVYEVWSGGVVCSDEWDSLFAATLRHVAMRLANAPNVPLLDPALGTPVQPSPANEDLAHAADIFTRQADLADEALAADDCQAAKRWREILGGNDRSDPVFPLPAGCAANGARIGAVSTVPRRARHEAPGFG